MRNFIKKIKIIRKWMKNIWKSDTYTYKHILDCLELAVTDLMNEAYDFFYIPAEEEIFWELLEMKSNIELMKKTKDINEYNLLKWRVDYMLQNKMENWYI